MSRQALTFIAIAFLSAAEGQMPHASSEAMKELLSKAPSKERLERAAKHFEAFKQEVGDNPDLQKQMEDHATDPETQKMMAAAFGQMHSHAAQHESSRALKEMLGKAPSKERMERAAKAFEAFKEEVGANPDMQKQIEDYMTDAKNQEKMAAAMGHLHSHATKHESHAALTDMLSKKPSKERMERASKLFDTFKNELAANPDLQKQIDDYMAHPDAQKKMGAVLDHVKSLNVESDGGISL